MNIKLANKSDLNTIKNIVDTTITEVYPLYYPKGAVDFFIQHHNNDNILSDIQKDLVYIMELDDLSIGTVTIKENHINRLFILPKYQSRGYGSILFKFAEDTIFKNHYSIILDTSLPSKSFYLKRGYREVEYQKILTSNGDYLCYDVMMLCLKLKDILVHVVTTKLLQNLFRNVGAISVKCASGK